MHAMAVLLLWFQTVPDDTIVTKRGETLKGVVTEYETEVVLLAADGKEQRLKRELIDKILYARVFIKFPRATEYRPDEVHVGRAMLFGERDRALAVNGMMTGPVLLVDPTNPATALKVPMGKIVGNVLVQGGRAQIMEISSAIDETQKYKDGEFEQNKEVVTLTLHVFDLASLKEIRTVKFDNNDRKDLLWKFIDTQIFQYRVGTETVVAAAKTAMPLDKGKLVKEEKHYTTFYFFDDDEAKKTRTLDNDVIFPDPSATFINNWYCTRSGGVGNVLRAFDVKQKKAKYEWPLRNEEGFSGRSGMLAVGQGPHYLTAYSFKSGKPQPKYPIDIGKGALLDLRDDALVVNRSDLPQPTVVYYDPESATEKYRISYAAMDGFRYKGRARKFELYTDAKGNLMGFDTVEKKTTWRFMHSTASQEVRTAVGGTTVYVLNTGEQKLYAVDLFTGEALWRRTTAAGTLFSTGPRTLVEVHTDAFQFVTDPAPVKGTKFFNTNGTPLANAAGRAWFATPTADGDRLATMDATGAVWLLRPEEAKVEAEHAVLDSPPSERASPRIVGGKIIAHSHNQGVVYDPAAKKRVTAEMSYGEDLRQLIVAEGPVWYVHSPLSVKALNVETAKLDWETAVKGPVMKIVRAGNDLIVLGDGEIGRLEAATGKIIEMRRIDASYRNFAMDADGSIYAFIRGFKLRKLHATKDQAVWTYSTKAETLPATIDWRGWAVVTGPHVLFATADREIAAIKVADGQAEWRYATPEFTGPPLLHQGRLYFTQKGKGLVALDVATGKPAWESVASDPQAHTPFVWKDQVYFWHADGYMVPAF